MGEESGACEKLSSSIVTGKYPFIRL